LEFGFTEIGRMEICVSEISAIQFGSGKSGFQEFCPQKVSFREIGIIKRSPPQLP
jgi:hypothetical protein